MLFNSYEFLLVFFPAVLAGHRLLERCGAAWQRGLLVTASLCFYAWWDVRFLPLLIGSVLGNHIFGRGTFAAVQKSRPRAADWATAAGIALNLLVLAAFKYANFFVQNLDAVAGTDFVVGAVILPLGISFFTFEQISFLVDIRRGQTRPSDLLRYALFVTFFPRLVAGPILRHDEIVTQLSPSPSAKPYGIDLSVGLTMFALGLVKKAVLADGIAPYASPVFAAAGHGQPLDFLAAWGGALAYTCQLYFDFSGYSDMAIGAARAVGIRFPVNFFSPYKATSIIEFWRRWHMTLSRFLRDYLYIPLGGNRRGKVRRYANLLATMLLGGLWHGAAWTFVFWGGLHGLYLVVNHAWLALAERSARLGAFRRSAAGHVSGFVLTFLAVVVAWVFFRAPSFGAALNMLAGMVGRHGIVVPSGLEFAVQPIAGYLTALGVRFGEGSGTLIVETYLWVGALLAAVWFLPNVQQITARYEPVLELSAGRRLPFPELSRSLLRWSPSRSWAVVVGGLGLLGFLSVTHASEFLYWQF